MKRLVTALIAAAAFIAPPARAEVKIGVIVSATGPAASVGITQQRTVSILPSKLGGQDVRYILLDDASDTSTTVTNARKLITEEGVDAIIGPSLTPNSLALLDVVSENKTPMISLAGSAAIVEPPVDKRRWVFKTPQSDAQMASIVLEHMKRKNIKTVGLIGFSDAYGEGWIKVMTALAEGAGIKVVASERYQRTDNSVLGQVLKITAQNPRRRLHRGFRHTGGAAADDAGRARLQGSRLSDAWGRE